MEAKELRIGNHTSNGIVVNIFEDHFFTRIRDINFNSKYHDANPIPLTEEWLIKFGLEKKDIGSHNINCFSNNSGFDINSYEKDFNGFWLRHYQSPVNNKFKYVHQLQNLYFALTGKELQ